MQAPDSEVRSITDGKCRKLSSNRDFSIRCGRRFAPGIVTSVYVLNTGGRDVIPLANMLIAEPWALRVNSKSSLQITFYQPVEHYSSIGGLHDKREDTTR
jgi:hypothetical protein